MLEQASVSQVEAKEVGVLEDDQAGKWAFQSAAAQAGATTFAVAPELRSPTVAPRTDRAAGNASEFRDLAVVAIGRGERETLASSSRDLTRPGFPAIRRVGFEPTRPFGQDLLRIPSLPFLHRRLPWPFYPDASSASGRNCPKSGKGRSFGTDLMQVLNAKVVRQVAGRRRRSPRRSRSAVPPRRSRPG